MNILQRLKVYGIGLILGCIIMFSVPKLRNNFLQYVDWGDANQWVINDLKFEFSDTSNIDGVKFSERMYNKLELKDIDSSFVLKVLDGGWVDANKSIKDSMPRLFVVDNKIGDDELSVYFYFDEKKHIVIVDDFYLNEGISKKSFFSYFAIFLIFLIIMVPTILLIRRMTRKRRMQDE